MTKRIWVIMLSCFCWQILHGANTKDNEVTGLIADERLRPVEFADVALFRAADSVFVTGSVSDAKGRFSFSPVDTGQYYVTYSFIGYETGCSETFTVVKGKRLDLGTLRLHLSPEQLDEVVVQGRRATYVQRIDKRVFYAGTDLMSTSGSASDLVRNIPSVQVDVEGKVSLRGSESVNILIDGKPSALMTPRMRANALRQIPAAEIERISGGRTSRQK